MYHIWIEKVKAKMFHKLQAQADKSNNKTEKFIVNVMPNIIMSIGVFLGMLWIFNKINTKYGIERVVIIFGIIVILNLRSISKTLSQAAK